MKNYWDGYPWNRANDRAMKLSPTEMQRVVWMWRERFLPGMVVERVVPRFGLPVGRRGVVCEVEQPETAQAVGFSYRIVRWEDGTQTAPSCLLFEDTRLVGPTPEGFAFWELADFEEFELPSGCEPGSSPSSSQP